VHSSDRRGAGSVRTSVRVFAALLAALAAADGTAQAIPQKNVNAIGPSPVGWLFPGNARKQQNEPECAVSPGNPNRLFCGYNDYRAVDFAAIGDAFPGVSQSRDGGLSWISGLHPGHRADTPSLNQQFGADANVSALPNFLLYNFIAGWRNDEIPGGVFVSNTVCLGDAMGYFKFIAPVGRMLGVFPILRVFKMEELLDSLKAGGFDIDYEWRPNNRVLFVVARKPEYSLAGT